MPSKTENRPKRIGQPGMSRIMKIYGMLRGGGVVTSKVLAASLERDVRTIGRDIAFMKDELKAPIEFDYAENTYRLKSKSWSLPFVQLNEWELVQLLTAERMVQQARGSPLADALVDLFEKIRLSLPGKVGVDPAVLQNQVSFHNRPARTVHLEVWEAVFQALRRQLVAEITYASPYDKDPKTRKLEPVHIACVDGDWYLVAWPLGGKGLRSYALSRMKNVKVTTDQAESHQFEPDQFFENRIGRYIGDRGKTRKLVLNFKADAARTVRERQWHPQQELKDLRGGQVQLTLPVPREAWLEIRAFILQWGAEVEVKSPREFRDRLKKEIQQILRVYKK